MQKGDDITRHGLYESEENNRGITIQKRWGQWTHASGKCSSGALFSLLTDFFYQKNQDNPIRNSEGMGPNPYCSNNMDGCDKQKGKKKRERGEKNVQRHRPYEKKMKVSEKQKECGKATWEKEKNTCSSEIIDFCDWQTQWKKKDRNPESCSKSGIKAHKWIWDLLLVCLGSIEK